MHVQSPCPPKALHVIKQQYLYDEIEAEVTRLGSGLRYAWLRLRLDKQ